jgi:hypothetical protein
LVQPEIQPTAHPGQIPNRYRNPSLPHRHLGPTCHPHPLAKSPSTARDCPGRRSPSRPALTLAPYARHEPAINSPNAPPSFPFRFPARDAARTTNFIVGVRSTCRSLWSNSTPTVNLASSSPSYSLLVRPAHLPNPFSDGSSQRIELSGFNRSSPTPIATPAALLLLLRTQSSASTTPSGFPHRVERRHIFADSRTFWIAAGVHHLAATSPAMT